MSIELLEPRDGYSRLAMTLKDNMLNSHGIANGGAIFSLADAAFAVVSNSRGQMAVALCVNIITDVLLRQGRSFLWRQPQVTVAYIARMKSSLTFNALMFRGLLEWCRSP